MPAYDFDLLIRAGRVFCADSDLDGPGDVRFDYNTPQDKDDTPVAPPESGRRHYRPGSERKSNFTGYLLFWK